MKILQDLGLHSTDLADILSATPFLLHSSADRLRRSILGLSNVLGANADICRLLTKPWCGKLLMYDLERTFVPNIEYLKSCGICSLLITSYVFRYPLILLTNQEKLKGTVERLDEMGFDRKSKNFLEAVKVISCMSRETWEHKLKLFRDLGFSEHNILETFRKFPPAFGGSEKKIKEVTQLLLSVEDVSISEIVNNPYLLGCSVEKRLKPRVQVYKALVSKNLLKKRPSLVRFCKISDEELTLKYLIPYSDEIGDLCVGSSGS